MFITHPKPIILMLLFAALLIAAKPATAQKRFTLSEIDDGYIMLNQETGIISVCVKSGANLTCNTISNYQKTPIEAKIGPPAKQVQNLRYYFNQFFSLQFQAKSSAFFKQLAKRLFDMTDELKAHYKEFAE